MERIKAVQLLLDLPWKPPQTLLWYISIVCSRLEQKVHLPETEYKQTILDKSHFTLTFLKSSTSACFEENNTHFIFRTGMYPESWSAMYRCNNQERNLSIQVGIHILKNCIFWYLLMLNSSFHLKNDLKLSSTHLHCFATPSLILWDMQTLKGRPTHMHVHHRLNIWTVKDYTSDQVLPVISQYSLSDVCSESSIFNQFISAAMNLSVYSPIRFCYIQSWPL